MFDFYEQDEVLAQYLLLHYGKAKDYKLQSLISNQYLDFPLRCFTECVSTSGLRALDLGCAVGRTTFELTKNFTEVTGVDSSEKFIQCANFLKKNKSILFKVKDEGTIFRELKVDLAEDLDTSRVDFIKDDVMRLGEKYFDNDLVIATNLICRLPEPKKFIGGLRKFVKIGGQLILISPYSWLEQYTEEKNWLSNDCISENQIIQLLSADFVLRVKKDLSFLIREHSRKYQLGVSQALIFEKSK